MFLRNDIKEQLTGIFFFLWNKLKRCIDLLQTSRAAITWRLSDHRQPFGLCLFRWREQRFIRKNHQRRPLMSKWSMCNTDPSLYLPTVSSWPHTQTQMHTNMCTSTHNRRYFFAPISKAKEDFQNCLRKDFVVLSTSLKQQLMCLKLEDKVIKCSR